MLILDLSIELFVFFRTNFLNRINEEYLKHWFNSLGIFALGKLNRQREVSVQLDTIFGATK